MRKYCGIRLGKNEKDDGIGRVQGGKDEGLPASPGLFTYLRDSATWTTTP
jgi:hypothetical protein